jgi:hypothetical protein
MVFEIVIGESVESVDIDNSRERERGQSGGNSVNDKVMSKSVVAAVAAFFLSTRALS